MKKTFIELPEFQSKWSELGLNDDDLKNLQDELLVNPQKGKVMTGTNGLRKIRVAFPNRGKRESARVCYVDFAQYETIYLITAYSKDEKSNLSSKERNAVADVIKLLDATLKRKGIDKKKE